MYGEHHRFRIRERKRKAVILCTDKKNVLYQHLEHKGHDGLTRTPVKDFDGILIHDHDKSYYSYGSKHQECLAHVLRYLVGAMENEPDLNMIPLRKHLDNQTASSKFNTKQQAF